MYLELVAAFAKLHWALECAVLKSESAGSPGGWCVGSAGVGSAGVELGTGKPGVERCRKVEPQEMEKTSRGGAFSI